MCIQLIYLFLVEKAVGLVSGPSSCDDASADSRQYIIRSGNKKLRLQSKLYIFNSFGMIGKCLAGHNLLPSAN